MNAEDNFLHLEAWLQIQGLLTLEAEPGALQRAETIILNLEAEMRRRPRMAELPHVRNGIWRKEGL